MPTAAALSASPPADPEASSADAQRALRRALDELSDAEARGQAGPLAEACQRLSRCYRALGAAPSAVVLIERALRWAGSSGAVDQALDLRCELAELLADLANDAERQARGSGRALRERARDQVFDATRLATGCADPQWEITLLLRLSDVLDRFGDRDDATVLQVRALQLTAGGFYTPAPPRAEDAVPLRRH